MERIKKHRKSIIFVAIVVLLLLPFSQILSETLTGTTSPIENVKEGDVIFQTSKSQQSPLIQIATRSKISHCGIIVMRNGKPYVLETLKTLKLTPLDRFIARGVDGKYWIKRPKDIDNIKIRYNKYLGRPYDLAFKFDNDRFYCSELVYDIYKNQLDTELCKSKKVSRYLILFTDRLPAIKKAMKRRGIKKDQYVVAPVDVFNSKYLESVK